MGVAMIGVEFGPVLVCVVVACAAYGRLMGCRDDTFPAQPIPA